MNVNVKRICASTTYFFFHHLHFHEAGASMNSLTLFSGSHNICKGAEWEWGLTWFGDALEVKHENEKRAEACRQEQASSSGHPHREARLCWRSHRLLVAASTRFIRDHPAEDVTLSEDRSLNIKWNGRNPTPHSSNLNCSTEQKDNYQLTLKWRWRKPRAARSGLCFFKD